MRRAAGHACRGRAAVVAALAATTIAVAAAPAGAATTLPVGSASGVQVRHAANGLTFVFTARAAKLYEQIAGRSVAVECTQESTSTLGISAGDSTSGVDLTAPQRRQPLRSRLDAGKADFCRLFLGARTVTTHGVKQHLQRRLVVSVPLTQAGAVYLDEQTRAGTLLGLLTIAGELGKRTSPAGYLTPAKLKHDFPKASELVALTDPSGTPPKGKIGYYSDGQQHAAAVMLSATGRRLYLEFGPDDALSTNVWAELFGAGD